MEKYGLVLLALWLTLSGFRACINNLGILTSPIVLGILQLIAGILLIIGLWPLFH